MVLLYKPSTKPKHQAKQRIFDIQSIDYQGFGVAKHEGKVWFVENALAGERVRATVVEEKSKYGQAVAKEWLVTAKERIAPICPHYATCGGCQMQHIGNERQQAIKQSTLQKKLTQLSSTVNLLPILSGAPWHYRRRVRLSIRYNKKSDEIAMGFRQRRSDHIVNIKQCPVLTQRLNQLLPELTALLQSWHLKEWLGHVELLDTESGIVLVLRHLGTLHAQDFAQLQQFAQQYALLVFLNCDGKNIEALGSVQPYYQLISPNLRLYFSAQDFIQVNAEVNQKMVDTALEWLDLKGNDVVLDLFCGVGNFSLPIASKVKRVFGIEGVAEMVKQALQNATVNALDNVIFYQADLASTLLHDRFFEQSINKVVLDPPRAGADFVIPQICQLNPEQVLYISCNPATLIRDSQLLIAQGYLIKQSMAIDMFPQTGHLESMTLFVRA